VNKDYKVVYIFHILSLQKCVTHKTVKIWNFAHKFAPQGRLVCTIFTKFSASVRIYGLLALCFKLVAFGGQTTKL